MPRRPPHFKVFASAKNHEKLKAVYWDNDLAVLWMRLGVEAIERYADRTGDTFIVHDRELIALTGKGRADIARRSLERLADVSPISVERDGDIWRITFRNLAKKQFDRSTNGAGTVPSSSASSTSTSEKSKKKNQDSEAVAEPTAAPWKKLAPLLAGAEDDERDAWLEAVGQEIHAAGEAETPRAKDEPANEHTKRVNAARVRIACARWRAYLKGPRDFRGHAERAARDARIAAAQKKLKGSALGADGMTDAERSGLSRQPGYTT